MTKEDFELYHEENFDAFSKSTIKQISKKIFREIAIHAHRETALSELSFQEEQKLYTEDAYSLDEPGICFLVLGQPIIIQNSNLAQALSMLPPKRRDVILLSYFRDETGPQIAKRLNINPSTVNRRHSAALHRLKEILEAMDYATS